MYIVHRRAMHHLLSFTGGLLKTLHHRWGLALRCLRVLYVERETERTRDDFSLYRVVCCSVCCSLCCSFTLRRTAAHCDTLYRTAAQCNTLQCIAAQCNTLQCTAAHCNTEPHTHVQMAASMASKSTQSTCRFQPLNDCYFIFNLSHSAILHFPI